MSIQGQVFNYEVAGKAYEGYLVGDTAANSPQPGVLVAHAWGGQGEFEAERARRLAAQGYVALALDVYGAGQRGSDAESNGALMQPLLEDRAELLNRLEGSLAALRGEANVDASRCAIIGYCFGGLCALDLARSGADINGAVSLHGLFNAPPETSKITAKVLALHGWADPMAPPESVLEFAKEMTAADADWQLQAYGSTMHSFTNPEANDPDFGTVYSASADQRSWVAMQNFLAEALA